MVDISKVLDGAANPVIAAGEKIIGASPGFVLETKNPKDFVAKIKSAGSLGEKEAIAGLKDFGISKVLDIADEINPALGNFGRSILGRGITDKTKYPADSAITPPDSWYSLARNRRDPAWAYDWDILMPTIGVFQLPNSYVEDVQINLPNLEDWSVFRNGTRAYYAGFSDVGTLTLTCYEDNALSSMYYFSAWLGTIQNQQDGTFSPPSQYLKDVTVFVTAPDPVNGGMMTIGSLTANGVFPKTRQGLNFSSGNSDRQRIQVDFAVNNVSFNVNVPPDPIMSASLASAASTNPTKSFLGTFAQMLSPSNDPSKGKFSLDLSKSPLDNMKANAGIIEKAGINSIKTGIKSKLSGF